MDKNIKGLGRPSATDQGTLHRQLVPWIFISMMFKRHQSAHFHLIVAHVRLCHWPGRPANSSVFFVPHFQTVNTTHDIDSGQWQIRHYGRDNVRCVLQ